MEQQLPLQARGLEAHDIMNLAYGDNDTQPPRGVPSGFDQQVSKAALMKGLASQLQSTGALGHVKSQLRAQLLSQLQKGQVISLQSSTGGAQSLRQRALNSMLAEYLQTANYPYSLSVFSEESGAAASPPLSEAEALDVLHINKASLLHQAYVKAKSMGTASTPKCTLVHLLDALTELGQASRGLDSSTQTAGSERQQLEARMNQLESEHQAKLRAARSQPAQGMEERMALYRQQIEEQARADVVRQVERVRQIEMASVRLEEAAKWRRTLEGERQELERLHVDRLTKLRAREEDVTDKLKRQQREVEALAFDHRQRLLREEERLRAWRQEASCALDGREEQLKHLARALELREKAIVSHEVSAESKAAEACQALSTAHVDARAEVEREYLELKATLAGQRLQLEMDRARVAEMRSEAASESAAARAKEDRLRALEASRMEAEARAAAHAAEAGSVRLQMERLQLELASARDELSHRVAQAAGTADAMLTNAAGALNMLGKEAQSARGAVQQLQELQRELSAAEARLAAQAQQKEKLSQERDKAVAQAMAAAQQAKQLMQQREQLAQLIEEALGARGAAQKEAEDAHFMCQQLQREVSELRAALTRAREDTMVVRLQSAGPASQPSWAASRAASPAPGLQHAKLSQIAAFRPGMGMHSAGSSLNAAGRVGHPFETSTSPRGLQGPWALQKPLAQPSEHGYHYGLAGQQIYVLNPPKPSTEDFGLATNFNASVASMEPNHVTKIGGNNVTTPIRDRLARLTKDEEELAGEMAGFKRRVAAQQQAGARELQMAITRVGGSPSPSSPHTLVTPGASRPVSPTTCDTQYLWLQPSQPAAVHTMANPHHTSTVPSLASYPTYTPQAPATVQQAVETAAATFQAGEQVPDARKQGMGSLGGFGSLPATEAAAQAHSTGAGTPAHNTEGAAHMQGTEAAGHVHSTGHQLLTGLTQQATTALNTDAWQPTGQMQSTNVPRESMPTTLSGGQSGSESTDTDRLPGVASLSFSDIPYSLPAAPPPASAAAPAASVPAWQQAASKACGASAHALAPATLRVPLHGATAEESHQALSFPPSVQPAASALPAVQSSTHNANAINTMNAIQPSAWPPANSSMPAGELVVQGSINASAALASLGNTTVAVPPPGLTLVRQCSGVAASVATEPGVMTTLLAQSRASSGLALSELLRTEGTRDDTQLTQQHQQQDQQQQQQESQRSFVAHSMSLEDVRNAQAAKLRLLQQQHEARLVVQRGSNEATSRASSNTGSDREEYDDDFGSHHSSPAQSSVGSSGGNSRPAANAAQDQHQSSSPVSSAGSSNSTQGMRHVSHPIAGRRSAAIQHQLSTDHSSHQPRSTDHSFHAQQLPDHHHVHALSSCSGQDDESEQEEIQLETAEHRHAGHGSHGSKHRKSGSDSLPSQLAELHLSVDDDTELVVDLDDDDDDFAQALGGTAIQRSSDGSVF